MGATAFRILNPGDHHATIDAAKVCTPTAYFEETRDTIDEAGKKAFRKTHLSDENLGFGCAVQEHLAARAHFMY